MVCVHDVHASSLPVRNTGSRFGVTRGAEWKGYVNLVMWGGGFTAGGPASPRCKYVLYLIVCIYRQHDGFGRTEPIKG